LVLAILLYLGELGRAGLKLLGLLVVCLEFLRVRLGELLRVCLLPKRLEQLSTLVSAHESREVIWRGRCST